MPQTLEEIVAVLRQLRPESNPAPWATLADNRWPLAPYSFYGLPQSVAIRVVPQVSGPVVKRLAFTDPPGIFYYTVNANQDHFWITYVFFNFRLRVGVPWPWSPSRRYA